MINKHVFVILFVFAKFHSFHGCTIKKNRVNLPCKEYNLNNPFRIKLGDQLTEISGIVFYPKDSSIFAISDEYGNLYKILLNKRNKTLKWKFDRTRDFEDVVLHDSTFYILESSGNIQSLQFSQKGDTIFRRKSIFPVDNDNKNEFESIFYDKDSKRVIMICKDCGSNKKNSVSAWSFDPDSGTYTQSAFSIDAGPIAKETRQEDLDLMPSAAAVNPLTGDVWILSSINQLLIVTDRKGNTKSVYTLNPAIFRQPEGISFTPWGDLLISNEATDRYETATLLIFKPEKRG